MKKANNLLICGCALLFCALPSKALSGTVTGTVVFTDNRGEGCSGTGCIFAPTGTTAPMGAIRIRLLGGLGQTIGESQTNSNNGTYSISWNDPLLWAFPSSGYQIRVTSENTGDWRITDEDDVLYGWTSNVTVTSNSQSLGTRTLGGDESANVFATTLAFWNIVVNNSSTLSSRMTNVRISVNVTDLEGAGCSGGTSCTDNRNHCIIEDGDGFSRPIRTVAHELGHAATGHALEVDIQYPGSCGAHQWTWDLSCEKEAWHEGIANMWATTVQWSKNAPDSNAFFGTSTRPMGVVDTTCANDDGSDTEACQSAALWDIYDDPTSDDDDLDDSLDMSVANIVAILNGFDGGFLNRQDQEIGDHANNQWDFLKNLDDLFGSEETQLREIYSVSNLCCGGEEPYGSCGGC